MLISGQRPAASDQLFAISAQEPAASKRLTSHHSRLTSTEILSSPRSCPFAMPTIRAGFTLIEILVVIAVIAILASLVSPMVFRNVGDAKQAAARAQIEIFGLALDAYRLDNDRYPTSEQGLAALRDAPSSAPEPRNWRGPYVRKSIPLDPWGGPYVYLSPGETNPESYDLYSLGRDGETGGEGEDADVTSWQ